jgi:rare lipoprotein A
MRFSYPLDDIRLFGIGLLLTSTFISACAGSQVLPTPVTVVEPSPHPGSEQPPNPAPVQEPVQEQATELDYRETGMASWYGKELQGKHTANGDVFDMYGLSAAHRTLPFGTVVRVINLDNFKSITVRINDRGPFLKSRILDLSYGAAKELGFLSQGTARVRIEAVESMHHPAEYTVQAAVFTEEENARLLKDRLNIKFGVVSIVPFDTNIARFYRVQIGTYASEDRAELAARRLMIEGLEPVVVRKD